MILKAHVAKWTNSAMHAATAPAVTVMGAHSHSIPVTPAHTDDKRSWATPTVT